MGESGGKLLLLILAFEPEYPLCFVYWTIGCCSFRQHLAIHSEVPFCRNDTREKSRKLPPCPGFRLGKHPTLRQSVQLAVLRPGDVLKSTDNCKRVAGNMLIDSILFLHSVLFPNIYTPISHKYTQYNNTILNRTPPSPSPSHLNPSPSNDSTYSYSCSSSSAASPVPSSSSPATKTHASSSSQNATG